MAKRKSPNRKNPVAQLSLAPSIHKKLDALTTADGLSRSAVVAVAIAELFMKRVKSGAIVLEGVQS